MRKRPRSYSITLRLLSTVILGMLALNVLTLYSTQRLVENTRTDIRKEYESVQNIYAIEIARQLTQAQSQIGAVSTSYMTGMATNATALHDERQYEALRCQAQLISAMRDLQLQLGVVTGYYVYGRDADAFIFQGSYEGSKWFESQLRKENTADAPFVLTRDWWLEETPFGQILISNTARQDLAYGAWVRLDDVWNALGLDAETARRLHIVPADAPAPSESYIDVLLGNTGFVIRQILPEAETALPFSVELLRYISWAMLLILPLSWLVLQRLVIRPLGELVHAIGEIESGNTRYRIPDQSDTYEFDKLNRGFNRAAEAIAHARSEVYEAQLENQRIRIRYLTQQMQPHFVLNTLNLIYSMEPEQYDLIQRTLLCLSRYYRYVAHVGEQLVPTGAELEHVKNYFQIQQIRYQDCFSYGISCTPEMEEALIPPLVIQTFAENALRHSLKVDEPNRVEVCIAEAVDGRIHICIRDTGDGYSQTILDKIHTFQQTRVPQDGLGLGIQNTIERLSLIYGEAARLNFGNAAEGGAQVDILLPLRFENTEKIDDSLADEAYQRGGQTI